MLSPTHRLRYEISYRLRRVARTSQNLFRASQFAKEKSRDVLPILIQSHETAIIRKLLGVDTQLFLNKRENLKLAIDQMNQLVIQPGRLFSFWEVLGEPVAKRGFLPGLMIRRGELGEETGGGLCQLSNALFWLALHTDLEVIERHSHSVDLFSEDEDRLPFGIGATVLFNYKDLRFLNPTPWSYQFSFGLTESHLIAGIYCSTSLPYRFEIRETDHEYRRINGILHRRNRLWKVRKGINDQELSSKLIYENSCPQKQEI